jgi:uncharacterized membrane protein YcaP (DUF421 family)
MRRARLVESEILAVMRGRGIARVEDVHAVVLESDGSLSVLEMTGEGSEPSTLGGVKT